MIQYTREGKMPRKKDPKEVAAGKRDYDNRYHREKMISIAFRLSRITDKDLIETYNSIPDKMGWFRESLRRFKEENE